jgi:uncharacterized protein (TIGR02145 family)
LKPVCTLIFFLLFYLNSFPQNPCPGLPSIKFAGKTYHTIQIGNQCWLKENLDVGTQINGSLDQKKIGRIEKYCYGNDSVNCDKYGGLYQWDEAMQFNKTPGAQGICPDGWHVPSNDEFTLLSAEVNKDGNALKGKDIGKGTNNSGFSGLLSGYYLSNGTFSSLGEYSYFWSSSLGDETNDSCIFLNSKNGNISQIMITEACAFSVRCIKNDQEYENKILKKEIKIENQTKEKKLTGETSCPGIPIVKYEGKTYHTLKIGDRCWLKENLDVGKMINGILDQTNNGIIEKYCYRNDSLNCNKFGGLYQWDEAMQYSTTPGNKGICPDGWHIPTKDEFSLLATDVNNDGKAIKVKDFGKGTNITGFSALVSGCRGYEGVFEYLDDYSYFWGSTLNASKDASDMYMSNYDNKIYQYYNDKIYGFSVRCIKDK